ncbi:biotin--[acetyl-CoA-carboxylase] ligase [bacterium]|nr:biotin--[acetyl-CoA-carboxylase] ligase [bacterium]
MISFDVADFQHRRKGSFGSELYYYAEIDSTNRAAEKLMRHTFREGMAVVANSQTSGRGRNNSQWFSPGGENLYCTLLLKPEAVHLHRIPFIAGLAIANALSILELKVDLKWPNDILVSDRKIGGILIQSAMEGGIVKYAAVGFGINVNTMEFPLALKETATSIAIEKGQRGAREPLLALVLLEVERLYVRMNEISWEDFCRELEKHSSYLLECEITIQTSEGVTEGVTAGLDQYGGLIVKTPGGQSVFYSGEVQACRKKQIPC